MKGSEASLRSLWPSAIVEVEVKLNQDIGLFFNFPAGAVGKKREQFVIC